MKTRAFVLAGLVSLLVNLGSTCSMVLADDSLSNSISILGQTLALKDKKGSCPDTPCIAEYIPAKETWDNWTVMYAVRFLPGKDLDPKASAAVTARNVIARKQSDPYANAAVFESNGDKGVIVDFLVSNFGKTPDFLEHNVFRYVKTPHGVVSYQIAERSYVDSNSDQKNKDFIQNIPNSRNVIFKEIARNDLPKFD